LWLFADNFTAYIDDIVQLRDAELFIGIINTELLARQTPGKEQKLNPTYVAKVVTSRPVSLLPDQLFFFILRQNSQFFQSRGWVAVGRQRDTVSGRSKLRWA